jgi:predicted phage terminase large subunit-like protein
MNLDSISVKDLLKSSPFYFAQKVFNYRVDGAHGKILQHLIDERFGLTLVARGHGKSKLLQAYLTFLAVNNPDIRIILVSDTDTKAVAFLRTIKQTIESSPILKENYPNLIGKQWSDHSIEIAGRSKIMTEPTIMAVGSGSGAATGLHCDYLALDDLVSFDSSRSELQRERTKSWFKTTLLPVLLSTGKISVVGTRYHPQDFYSMIMDELHYKTLILKAIQPDNTALIPWLMPYEDKLNENDELIQKGLKTIREELGNLIFEMQFQNSVELANENHIIQYDYIQYYDSIEWIDNQLYVNIKGSSIKIKKINLGVDPAISEKEAADFTGMCVIGKGSDNNFYVLDVLNKHLTLNLQINAITEFVNKWQVNQTLIEDVAYQKALIQELKRRTGLKIVPITPTRDKTSRLNMVSGHFESKKVYFKKNMNQIINQLLEFPDGRNDDLVDACVYSLWGFRQAGSGMIVMRI